MTNNETESIIEVSSKKNVILDATTLSSLMSCARLTDFHFNLNLVSISGKSNSLEAGSIVHKILEVFNKNVINGFNRATSIESGMIAGEMYWKGCIHCTDFTPFICHDCGGIGTNCNKCNELGEITRPICGHQINEYTGTKNVPNISETYKIGWDRIQSTVLEYFDFYKNDSWVPLEVEVVKGKILYEDDEIRILWKAKLDLTVDTNQGIYPVDHKTMKQRRDQLKMNNQFMGQCIIMNTRNVIIDKIGFQTTLKPNEKFTRNPVSYSNDALFEWQSVTLPFYAKLMLMYNETGYWPPNFTHCENKYGNCSFCNVCEADRNMREEIIKQNFITGAGWNPENIVDE